jgi:hypothetical protein
MINTAPIFKVLFRAEAGSSPLLSRTTLTAHTIKAKRTKDRSTKQISNKVEISGFIDE